MPSRAASALVQFPKPDKMFSSCFKLYTKSLPSHMRSLIYNESLAQGTAQDDRRQANVDPIFKKGEKYDAANYRPVSLTCICCKHLEHKIVSNINKHLAFESIFADCQHGFRSQSSCETQLVLFYHDMVGNPDRALNCSHRQTGVIIMDFAKAFVTTHEAIVQTRQPRN